MWEQNRRVEHSIDRMWKQVFETKAVIEWHVDINSVFEFKEAA